MVLELREYAPVPLSAQIKELEAQIQIHKNMANKWIERHRVSEPYALAQLQRLQSALRSLRALERLLGPDTALTTDDLVKRLSPPTESHA